MLGKLFAKKKEEEKPAPQAAPANGWVCKACGKTNSNSQQDCPRCGEPRYKNG